MANGNEPLKEGDCGPYGEVADRSRPEGLRPLFMPSLAALLARAEQLKGAPLTEEEVGLIRDRAQVVITRSDVAEAVEGERGYPEVDPTSAWESWQTLRSEAG